MTLANHCICHRESWRAGATRTRVPQDTSDLMLGFPLFGVDSVQIRASLGQLSWRCDYGQLPLAVWSSTWSQSRFKSSNALIFKQAAQ